MRSRRSHVERDRRGWCNVERTPDWPCFLVGPRVDCPHRQPRKNTRLHCMVVKDFIAHGISRIPRDATSRGMRRGLSGRAHLERNRRAGAGTSRRVCAALVRRTTRALRRVGSAAAVYLANISLSSTLGAPPAISRISAHMSGISPQNERNFCLNMSPEGASSVTHPGGSGLSAAKTDLA